MDNKEKIYLAGGLASIVALIYLFRKGNADQSGGIPSSVLVSQPQPAGGANQTQALNVLGSLISQREKNATDVTLAGQAVQLGIAKAQISADQQNTAISAALASQQLRNLSQERVAGLQAESQARSQSAQTQRSVLNGLMSQLGSVLNAIRQQQQTQGARTGSAGSSGGIGSPVGQPRANTGQYPRPRSIQQIFASFFRTPPGQLAPNPINWNEVQWTIGSQPWDLPDYPVGPEGNIYSDYPNIWAGDYGTGGSDYYGGYDYGNYGGGDFYTGGYGEPVITFDDGSNG